VHEFFSIFLGCAQLIGAGVTVAHHIKLMSVVRMVIELIPFPLAYMIFLSFSQNFSRSLRSLDRNEKFGHTT